MEPDYYPLREAVELGLEGLLLRLGSAGLDPVGLHHLVPSHCYSWNPQSILSVCGSENQKLLIQEIRSLGLDPVGAEVVRWVLPVEAHRHQVVLLLNFG